LSAKPLGLTDVGLGDLVREEKRLRYLEGDGIRTDSRQVRKYLVGIAAAEASVNTQNRPAVIT
jgi:hypothetical protein